MKLEEQETARSYAEEELMTVKEAMYALKVSRSTLSRLREEHALNSVYRNRHVRLIREEIEKASRWYSVPKGKI